MADCAIQKSKNERNQKSVALSPWLLHILNVVNALMEKGSLLRTNPEIACH